MHEEEKEQWDLSEESEKWVCRCAPSVDWGLPLWHFRTRWHKCWPSIASDSNVWVININVFIYIHPYRRFYFHTRMLTYFPYLICFFTVIVERVFWLVVERVVLWSGWAAGWRCPTGGLRHFDPSVCILSIIVYYSSIFIYDRVLLMYLLPQFPGFCFVLLACLCVFLQNEKKRLID